MCTSSETTTHTARDEKRRVSRCELFTSRVHDAGSEAVARATGNYPQRCFDGGAPVGTRH